MKKIYLLSFTLLLNCFAYSQYSNYYNVQTKSEINTNLNIDHKVQKTITTIDYGALQIANAQKEKNRLEQQKFADERQRQIAIEIAEDPTKSYDYGTWTSISTKDKATWNKEVLKKTKEQTGLKEFKIDYIIPNELLFNKIAINHIQNISKDGITTDIYIFPPNYNKDNSIYDIEKDLNKVIIGEELEELVDNNIEKSFYHKKDLNRATVFGNKGYKASYIWEDKFENHITENYSYFDKSIGNGVTYLVKVRFNGDKDEVDFEKLEGRRFYLKLLIEKIISTAKITEIEILR